MAQRIAKYVRPAAESAEYTASHTRELLSQMRVLIQSTKGVSMRPLIYGEKDYVAIEPLQGEPEINDILLFEQIRKGETVCVLHRLIKVTDAESHTTSGNSERAKIYITRGDNCYGCEYIRREDIIGRVKEIYRRGSDRKITMTSRGYLFYVRFWNAIWPLRKLFYRVRGLASRIYHFFRN